MAENGDNLNPEEKCKLITRNLQVRIIICLMVNKKLNMKQLKNVWVIFRYFEQFADFFTYYSAI